MKAMVARETFAALTIAVVLGSGAPAKADPVADFYHGKTVNVLIGVAPGGEYDLHARLVARYIGKYIPGNPTVVPQNMTGAGGLRHDGDRKSTRLNSSHANI